MRANNKRIVRYRKPLNINIGIILFALIFLYISICTFLYFTREKVSIYEVTGGKSENQLSIKATGVALRKEVVSYAPSTGYINYYVKEGTRISLDTTLYTIDGSGTVAQLIETAAQNHSTLTDDNISSLKKNISKYVLTYDDTSFYDAYQFQYDLNTALIECVNLNILESINQSLTNSGNPAFVINKAQSTGIVEFYTDGYEGVTADTITEDMFNRSTYKKSSITPGSLIENGTAIYKTINDEEWSIVVPLTSEQAAAYANTTIVPLRLVSENINTSGYFSIKQLGGNSYGIITLKRFMMKYAAERFIDIEISGETTNGLKIPKTAVTDKEFYVVPKEYMLKGGNNNEPGFSRQIVGTENIEFITPDIFATVEDMCYIEKSQLSANDVLVKTDSQSKYVVGAVGSLKGVYNVNTGFTIFRYIEILSEKNGYYIIKKDTVRGLTQYDHIVLNASIVEDNSVIFH